ncbi:DUF1194 domain-containing protein [Cereibacter johrii]|uniref:Uncharacterized protein DUF1194 n=1 Tax=Cereibacter johrii TaxID=445629 RepID=A0ABX5J5Z9_9RHOB|nr:DUF1194 domain-containing protein [Cereibacter johrii]ODM44376.1 hypothetical protein A9O63_04040 [Cereibacter johrii]PTM78335.1 uncharacterized protein DUF1194 [Cereibacter johrii]
MSRLPLLLLSCLLAAPAARASDCPDLALVLALDSSLSIDRAEFALQTEGYAEAFRSPAVQAALAAAGTVDVAAVVWSDGEAAPARLGWERIAAPEDARRLAVHLAALERVAPGRTGVGGGLAAALEMLAEHGCAGRRLVNLSGDGRETLAPRKGIRGQLTRARAEAEALGATVNALAVTDEEADLPDWFRSHVIVGPGAFVMETPAFRGFAEAVARKLVREIAPPALAASRPVLPPRRLTGAGGGDRPARRS